MMTGYSRRVYRPKSERTPSAAKSSVAVARPRDARGHFLSVVGDRDGLGSVVRPAALKGRGEPKTGHFVALSGADGV